MNTNLRNNIRRRDGRAGLLLLLLVAALLAPIWTVRYIPAGDYPNHLASAFVLAHLDDPAFHSFYRADWNTYPYLTMSWILVLLQKVVSIDLAGRLLLSLCVLAIPAAVWWFLRETNPGEEMLAVWALVTAQNAYFFLNGFVNMQLGFALCFVVLAGWTRWMKNPRILSWCLLLVTVTALYLTHLMATGVTGLILAVYTLMERRRLQEVMMGGALFLPAMGLFWHSQQHREHWKASFGSVYEKLAGFAVPVLGVSGKVDLFTFVVMVCAWIWVCYRNPDWKWQLRWAVPAGLLFTLYWVFPATYGPGLRGDCRFVPFAMMVSLAAVKLGSRLRPLVMVALLLFFVRAITLEYYWTQLQPHLNRLVEVSREIPSGARVLPVFAPGQEPPFLEEHLWSFGLIERRWVSPCLFHDPGVQPLIRKVEIYNPNPKGLGFCGELKQIDWSRIRQDYDYLWAYQSTEYEEELRSIACIVDSSDGLVLYRVQR